MPYASRLYTALPVKPKGLSLPETIKEKSSECTNRNVEFSFMVSGSERREPTLGTLVRDMFTLRFVWQDSYSELLRLRRQRYIIETEIRNMCYLATPL